MKRVLLFISIITIAFGLPASAAQHDEYPVSPPPFSEGIFPCSNCHAGLELNTKKRDIKGRAYLHQIASCGEGEMVP